MLLVRKIVLMTFFQLVFGWQYVEGVVASEAPIQAPLEMLKAQAVLVQTLISQGRQADIIGDSTQSQCYLGASLVNENITQAVRSVFGKQLYYKNKPIEVYYHSTCAGGTGHGARFFNLSGGSYPYLNGVVCKNCQSSPFWKTTSSHIPHYLFTQKFGDGIPNIVESDATNRPQTLELKNGKRISAYNFWMLFGQKFGWDKCPGTRFNFSKDSSGDFVIKSIGAGHGVGLCQWGACGLAKQDKSYLEILQYYFPNTYVR